MVVTTTPKSELVAICQSFDALDEGKTGFLNIQQFHLLWLGLGYGRITEEELGAMVPDSERISFRDVKAAVAGSHRRHPRKRNLDGTLVQGIDAMGIMTGGRTASGTVVTATDLQRLSREAGEPLSLDECEAMMGSKTEWTKEDVRLLLS